MKIIPCKQCGYPPNTMPQVQPTNDRSIWICPVCGNQGYADTTPWKGQEEHEKPKPMTEVLETK